MRTLSLLQWNMKCQAAQAKGAPTTLARRESLLKSIVEEHTPSLVLLQEAQAVASPLPSMYAYRRHKGLLTGFLKAEWAEDSDPKEAPKALGLALRHLAVADSVWVWNVHFSTGMYDHSREETDASLRKAHLQMFENARQAAPLNTEIVAGDFNCSPFEMLVAGPDIFSGNRCLEWVRRRNRGRTTDRRLFNPSWSILGSTSGAMGTYYHTGPSVGPWLVFDQILMSPEHAIDGDSQVKILLSAGGQPLAHPVTGRPNDSVGSDHFPMLTKLQVGTR